MTSATREAVRELRAAGRDARAYKITAQPRPVVESAASKKSGGGIRALILSAGMGNPADRNYYTGEFIQSAVPLIEGADAFYDHPSLSEDKDIPERRVRDKAGWWADAEIGKFTDPEHPELGARDGVFATFYPRSGDPQIAGLLETAAAKAAKYPNADPFLAFSINAYGVGQPGSSPDDGSPCSIMNRMTDLKSIDAVTAAGARGRPVFAANARESRGRLTYIRGEFMPTVATIEAGRSRGARPKMPPNFFLKPFS
ncbi:MAG: hypothetical protein GIX03_00240 [Candidatus Eremiobacteraeota bacterium]|nr:hypothetical protein [Candidatus Eremiobacteraeota bacterium]MBC5801451.1 hypothetical protein [Candidatus Eremiobacteraeota bacterium]MBC5821280.1 hypothetical protein [Candidatus Eremiobacteraeota bacterium]